MKKIISLLLALSVLGGLYAQDIALPAPQKSGGLTILEALAKRSTGHSYDASRDLSSQQLANLLWAGFGVNRADGRRTAPSASNTQEIEIYVLMKQGAYVYDAPKHSLKQVSTEDLRSAGGNATAPVSLIYVADLTKRSQGSDESKKNIACINSGFISENIYLYCASEGMSTGYRGGYNKETLTAKLKLLSTQALIAAQSVGFPKS